MKLRVVKWIDSFEGKGGENRTRTTPLFKAATMKTRPSCIAIAGDGGRSKVDRQDLNGERTISLFNFALDNACGLLMEVVFRKFSEWWGSGALIR